jgi:fructose-bisphosphate aldolase class II
MLVNLASILEPAVDADYGVASFNVFGWEDARAVVDAAEECGAPVILSANLDFVRFMPVELIAHMFRALAEGASVSVCAHLDHSYDIGAVLRAVEAGFTSVMYDGSQLPIDDNIAGTRRVAAVAHRQGCSVEAEIGSVPYAEGRDHIKSALTEVGEAVRIVEETGLDALAVSVGNVHRLKKPGAKIDFDRIKEIQAAVRVPLVIHGTSGIAESDLARLTQMRIAKFNVGTSLRQAFGRGLRDALAKDPERFDRLEIMRDAMPHLKQEAARVIRVLGWNDR